MAFKLLKTIVSGGRELKCQACGQAFVCNVSLKGCWCSEVKLTDETRTTLRSRYSDCLCHACLVKHNAASEPTPAT